MNTLFYQSTPCDYGEHEAAMQAYLAQGTERARKLDNRGPVRFAEDGRLAADIMRAYERYGFYVFTGVLGADELADLEHDVCAMWQNAPVTKGAALDAENSVGGGGTGDRLFGARLSIL